MHVVAVVQARMGSSRLPGKVMLPLDCDHVLKHVIRRTETAQAVDETVVATSEKQADTIVERVAACEGTRTHRGSETDVLGRMYDAAATSDADVVVRITADCPLLSPAYIDTAVDHLRTNNLKYVSSPRDGTFPIGVSSEVFTFDSFTEVESASSDPAYREHVTPLYYKSDDRFRTGTIDSSMVFDEPQLRDRSELRLTLDEVDDYELFRRVYENVPFDGILPLSDAVIHIDEHDIADINSYVSQKQV